MSRIGLALLTTLLSTLLTAAATAAPHVQAVPSSPASGLMPSSPIERYTPPVPGQVRRGFEAPQTRFGAGHRGVDLATSSGELVRADGTGTVTFAGVVTGRGVLVITHHDGIRTEVEPVRVRVDVGTRVQRGEVIAVVAGTHEPCRPGRCLHWSARRGTRYFDPLSLLAQLGPVRLLPWRG